MKYLKNRLEYAYEILNRWLWEYVDSILLIKPKTTNLSLSDIGDKATSWGIPAGITLGVDCSFPTLTTKDLSDKK